MKTVAIFRMIEGEVIALFPYEAGDNTQKTCSSYMHVGQHGAASVALIDECCQATPEEYAPLAAELKMIGYDLDIRPVLTEEDKHKARRSRLKAIFGC